MAKNFVDGISSPGLMEREVVTSAPRKVHCGKQAAEVAAEEETAAPSGAVSLHPGGLLPGCQERRPRRDKGGATGTVAASPGFHASDRSDSPKPRQRVRRRLAGAPAAACRSRA
ncbi:hypothetical protein D3J17_005136 [Escherichia coli]|nr:hypothetical protein [Escherichia coli]EEZ8004593.1 hypothetical protein [Escherichia coli]EFJ5374745.1 hypothetical protein [Escherichia coli]EGU0782082.1 hypothetical protein [Escherichia coli]MBZ8889663.1 hypothetical protein [Escherichia coli]